MGRRHGPDGAFRFDLVPDDGAPADEIPAARLDDEGALPQAPPDAGSTDGPWAAVRRRWRRWPRRTRLATLVTAAALAAVVVVVDGALDQGRHDELRRAAGGVVDLSAPPAEAWRVSDPPGSAQQEISLAGISHGIAVVQRRDELRGIDLVTGQERWTVTLPDPHARCGPGIMLWSEIAEVVPTSRVVCVSGAGATATTVTAADGTVLARRQVEDDHDLLVPGPDGGLLTARWVGDPGDVDVSLQGDPMTDVTVVGEIDDGYDLQLRMVDAVTGEERWAYRVPFGAVTDERQCVRWNTGGRHVELDRSGDVDHLMSGHLIGVSGCGVLAYLTPSGDPLDLEAPDTDEGGLPWRVRPLADGGYAVSAGWSDVGGRTHAVLDESGRQRVSVEGRLLDPWATDGARSGELMVASGDRVTMLDAEGDELWTTAVETEAQLARTGAVAVVLDDRDRVVGLDRATGDVLWVRQDLASRPVPGDDAAPRGEITAVFTDGRVVALVTPEYGDAAVVSRWQAIDVATGEDLWSTALPHEGWGVDLAVDGHLVRWWPRGIAGFTTAS